ncbi:MAG: hypothetical protein IKM43_03750 [Clostridia bacterium]|nr:hypothetical protein [Clostridia bacterium]
MKKICVIFGGSSSEHDISIITGMQLAKNYGAKEKIEKIYLSLDNRFYLATEVQDLSKFEDKQNLNLKEIVISNGAIFTKGLFWKKYCDIECMINCCHGGVGENGDLAGFFAVNNVVFTSSDSLTAHITMDKDLTKQFVCDIVPTIKGYRVTKTNKDEMFAIIDTELSDDLIVKPNSLGSSIGVMACDKSNYKDHVEAIFELNDDALVEDRVVDITEYNQACFKDKDKLVLSAIENPISKSEILSFDDKYKGQSKAKGKDRIIPAKINKKLEQKINEYTSLVYSALNIKGVARIDYIYDTKSRELYFNEINTVPGSMSFYLYEPIGIDYITLVDKLVENASKPNKYTYFDTEILKDKKI